MSDIAEGIGAAVEGTLAGRAVEPNRGEARFDPGLATSGENACLNCGHAAPDNFCPNCGQKTSIHRTLSAILHDLIHGVLHLDGKLWRTLPLLAFKPGQLTRRYIDGERAKFVSPMAMFLFSIFAMFAVFQIAGISTPSTFNGQIGSEQVQTSLAAAIENNERTLAEIEGELAELSEDETEERARLERRRANVMEELEGLSAMASLPFVDADPSSVSAGEEAGRPIELAENGAATMTMDETGVDWLDRGLAKKWKDNPGLMLYKLQANAYKFSWLLIPLSIPFVWLTFAWRRQFKAYDHAIFVTYSQAFVSLLFIVISIMFTIPALRWVGGLLMILIPPLHLYKQLRGAYGLSRFSALWRLAVIGSFIWIVIALFIQILVLLGAF